MVRWFSSFMGVLASVCLGSGPIAAQPTKSAPVVTVASAFGDAMRTWMSTYSIAKASVAVMRNDRLVYAEGFGGQNASERVGVWSLSKAITAACVATLVRDGKLKFEDPIGEHLRPLFALFDSPKDPRLNQVTIWQLVAHRSGLPTHVGGNRFAPGTDSILRKYRPADARSVMLMREILQLSLAADPGEKYQYSNVGYLLLGRIIEIVTGRDYDTACRERVLDPAGIKAASIEPTWGRLTDATAGWMLSGPEYLAFARVLRPRQRAVLDIPAHARLRSAEGHWLNAEGREAYTLGVIIRPIPGAEPNIFHTGGWDWRQLDAAGGAIDQNSGTLFLLGGDGIAWFASFDRVSRDVEQRARRELGEAMWRAKNRVSLWPDADLFATFNVEKLRSPP